MKKQREAGFLIAKIHQISNRILNQLLKDEGIEISTAQGRIMFALWKDDNIPIRELGKRTALEKSTLTSMLDRLEESGYILRRHSHDDRRKILIQRTPKDIALEKKYVAVSQAMNALMFSGFGENEKDTFEASLRRIVDNLKSNKRKYSSLRPTS